jgi:hypothetical protein
MGQMIRVDGVVGWPLICKRITRFDAKNGKYEFLRKVPKEATRWATFTVRTNLAEAGQMLALDVPKNDGSKGVIFIDTGSVGDGGIGLSPQLWHQWQHAHPNVPRGLVRGSGLLSDSLTVEDRAWASRFSVGALELTDVVLGEVEPAVLSWAPNEFVATFGFATLKRLDLIVDGDHGLAYLRPLKTPMPPPSFLSGGAPAIFVPRNSHANDLIAHVFDGSPAFEAGIRNGDILLKIGNRDIAQWLANPGEKWCINPQMPIPTLMASSNSPAGTKLELTLRRGGQTFKANVLQRAIMIVPLPEGTNSLPLNPN